MKRAALVARTLALAVAAGGCGAKYVYGPVANTPRPAKGAGCAFALLDAAPERPFVELGILAPRDIEYGTMSGGPGPFKEAVAEQVCAAGGDAVVVERDYFGRYVRGTVLAYK